MWLLAMSHTRMIHYWALMRIPDWMPSCTHRRRKFLRLVLGYFTLSRYDDNVHHMAKICFMLSFTIFRPTTSTVYWHFYSPLVHSDSSDSWLYRWTSARWLILSLLRLVEERDLLVLEIVRFHQFQFELVLWMVSTIKIFRFCKRLTEVEHEML